MTVYYPPPAFYFTVRVLGHVGLIEWAYGEGHDARFQEVSGISSQWEFDPVEEGGENRFQHRLPKRGGPATLVLKRGAVTTGSPLLDWVSRSVATDLAVPILTQHLLVMLLNERGSPVVAWVFANAYPVKSEVSSLQSTQNEVLVETFELAYTHSWRVNRGAVAAG